MAWKEEGNNLICISPRYQVNGEVLEHTKNANAEIGNSQISQEEVRYRPEINGEELYANCKEVELGLL